MKLILSFLFGIFYSSTALACAGCYSANGGSVAAFRWSVVFLTTVPLTFICSFIFWFRHHLKNKQF